MKEFKRINTYAPNEPKKSARNDCNQAMSVTMNNSKKKAEAARPTTNHLGCCTRYPTNHLSLGQGTFQSTAHSSPPSGHRALPSRSDRP